MFASPPGTNQYPLTDRKTHKRLPLPSLAVVNFSERVLMSREGDERGVLMLQLRTTEGLQLVLDEHKPQPVTLETANRTKPTG